MPGLWLLQCCVSQDPEEALAYRAIRLCGFCGYQGGAAKVGVTFLLPSATGASGSLVQFIKG